MAPAFPTTGRAAALGGVLLFFLTLPITLYWIDGTSREEAYCGISERAGAFDFIRRNIFETSSDLAAWSPWLHVTNSTGSLLITVPMNGAQRFYRAHTE